EKRGRRQCCVDDVHSTARGLICRETISARKIRRPAQIVMTIDDVEHYSDDEKKKIIASYQLTSWRPARRIPVLGSGRIFPVEESKLEDRDFPPHWLGLI